MSHNLPPPIVADMGALALVLTSWAGYMPVIAAGLGALWYLVQLYDRFFNKE